MRGDRTHWVVAALAAIALTAGALASGAAGQEGASGVNDYGCEPPAAHPKPVVLVHGTYLDKSEWNTLSPMLLEQGYCVFALDYGNRGTGPIGRSSRMLRAFVHGVRIATDARRVAIVGHSQGGMMPRHLIKFQNGKRKVAELIGLVPSNHGTTNPLAPIAADGGCPACGQQVAGSHFLERLNRGDETPGRVDYTQISTRYDEVVTPYQSAFLGPDGRRVTNVTVQDRCPADSFDHIAFSSDPVALQWVLDALRRPGPAAEGFVPAC